MAAAEMLTSFVNRWECDELDHLNVQFYFSRFEESDRQFRHLTGLSESLVGARRVRHVRFLKELQAGDLLTVSSSIAFDGPHMLTVLHEMMNMETGDLVATAVDGYAPPSSAVKTLRTRFKDYQKSMPDDAAPQGLSASPFKSRPTLESLRSSGSRKTYLGTVMPRDVSVDGRVDDAYAVACFSQAAPQIWQQTALNATHLRNIDAGRAVLEMKLSWISPLKEGDMLVIESALTQVQNNSFVIRHHLYENRTHRLAAICDVVVAILHKPSRTIVPIEESIQRQMSSLIMS